MPQRHGPYCEGSKSAFDPNLLLASWGDDYLPQNNYDFGFTIIKIFDLGPTDDYVYRAMSTTTLRQAQAAIDAGNKNGLHAWYRDDEGNEIPPPSSADITAYTSLFASTSSLQSALNGFRSNAKKSSLRASTAAHISSHFVLSDSIQLPKKLKSPHINPYYDIWAWSCQNLEWGGPVESTVRTKISHHVLPILYHHFGCICPSYTALHLIAQLAQPDKPPKQPSKPILDVGSGCGYWTCMLRRLPLPEHLSPLTVHAIDNQASLYRTAWIPDTIFAAGTTYLERHDGGKDAILLLVYPQTTDNFTEKVLRAYKGDTIVVAGTQNRNGFTGFANEIVDEWIEREMPGWEKLCQIPLPSFAGKDEALFVFRKRKVENA